MGKEMLPGNFFGFLIGTNFAPIAKAMGGPNIKPLASIPLCIINFTIRKIHKHILTRSIIKVLDKQFQAED